MQVLFYAAGKENILSALKLTCFIMGALQLVNGHDVVLQAVMYLKKIHAHSTSVAWIKPSQYTLIKCILNHIITNANMTTILKVVVGLQLKPSL